MPTAERVYFMQRDQPENSRLAYSYLRFSSPDQQYGDSIRRQTALAEAYALEFNLILDHHLTYQDFGISGFRGQNAASGRLGDFLTAITAGLVPPGSKLLVENLDRLSRDSALHAQNLLTQIVLAGVSVVTLSDRRTYSIEELRRDPMGLIFALINFIRANEESELKSSRAKANWVAKRATALTKPLTARCPGWLLLDKATNRFVQIPERVRVVRLIFNLVDQGQSFTEIAKILNLNKTPMWTGKSVWNRNTVSNIVAFSAVIGTYVPHHQEYVDGRMVRRPLAPIPNYYPAVVSIEQFDRVQNFRLSNYTGGKSLGDYLLQHLAVCSICGHYLKVVARSEHGPRVACSAAIAGAASHYLEIPYQAIDQALRRKLPDILRSDRLTEHGPGSSNRLRLAQNVVDRARRELFDPAYPALKGRAASVTRLALRAAEDEMFDAVESYESRASLPLRRKIGDALECLAEPTFVAGQAPVINRALRAIFSKVIIDLAGEFIELHWADGGIELVPYESTGQT